jgi:hypothetical protein
LWMVWAWVLPGMKLINQIIKAAKYLTGTVLKLDFDGIFIYCVRNSEIDRLSSSWVFKYLVIPINA